MLTHVGQAMAGKFIQHPGRNYVYVICDTCGRKVRQKDTVLVSDRFNYFNKMVVCITCTEKTNQQSIPIIIKEKLVDNPYLLRPEQADQYIVNTNASTVPSAPINVRVFPDSILGNTIILQWNGPDNPGNSQITGYIIKQAIPQSSTYLTLVANTNSNACSFIDNITPVSTICSYRIAAINASGIGTYSLECFYPYQTTDQYTNYIVLSQDSTVLTTGSGLSIVLAL